MDIWDYDYISLCGKRDINEDRVLLTENIALILDGHGYKCKNKEGNNLHVVDLVIELLPNILENNIAKLSEDANDEEIIKTIQDTCLEVDKYIYEYYDEISGGCTMTGVMNVKGKIFMVNIGDSETIIVNGIVPIIVSNKHKPLNEEERKRIIERGGYVCFGRVNGRLALSRAFGDYEHGKINLDKSFNNESPIWAMPDVVQIEDKYTNIFIYSDGFGDHATLSTLVTLAFSSKNDLLNESKSIKLCNAVMKYSKDNITVLTLTPKNGK